MIQSKKKLEREDAKVRFVDDGPNGPTFIRYDDCLMTWPEFVRMLEKDGLTQEFVQEYVNALKLEQI